MKICSTLKFNPYLNGIIKNLNTISKQNVITSANFETTIFADGEMLPTFNESIRDEDVVIIGSTEQPHDNIFEMLLIIDAARRANAKKITCIIPFFGYARQDRRDGVRCSHGSKVVANLLENAGVNQMITFDIHATQIDGNFNIPFNNYTIDRLFYEYINGTFNLSNTILCSPDAGGVKRVELINQRFGEKLDIVTILKKRKKANEVDSMQLLGDVVGKDVIIVDDILDTAGTLTKAVDYLLAEGAKSVSACITHLVGSRKYAENIANSKLKSLVVANTISNTEVKLNAIRILNSKINISCVDINSHIAHILYNLYTSQSLKE